MTPDLFAALLAFAFAATITPGPNNIMVMASGANFGYARTLPHILGVAIGFTVLVFLVGVGLGGLFRAVPRIEAALRMVAALFLLYLAWKTATASPPKGAEAGARPLSFAAAAAFQWVNPKAWAMALSAHAVYAPGGGIEPAACVAAAFLAVSVPCLSLWTLAGSALQRALARPRVRRAFNAAMAVLLVACMAPALLAA